MLNLNPQKIFNTQKLVNKKYLELFIPSLLILTTLNICGIVDSLIVSVLLGNEALSIVQIFSPAFTIINIFVYLIGVGGQILITTAKSKFKKEEANSIFSISILSSIIFGIIIGIIGFIFQDYIIILLSSNSISTNSLIFLKCKTFLSIFLLALPFCFYSSIIAEFLKIDNHPMYTSIVLMIINFINIILNIFLITQMGMGVEGSITATLLSEIIGTILFSYYLISKYRTLKFRFPSKIKTSLKILKNNMITGFPGASSYIYLSLGTLIINLIIINVIGFNGLGAYSLCNNLMIFGSIIIYATGQTNTMMTPVYYMEKNYKNVKYIFLTSVKISLLVNIIITLFAFLYPDFIIQLFNLQSNYDLINIYRTSLQIFALYFVPATLSFLILFYYQSIRKTRLSSIMFFIMRFLGPVMIASLALIIKSGETIWFAYAGGSILSLLIIYIIIKTKFHKNNKKIYNSILFIDEKDEENTFYYTYNNNITDENKFKKEIINHLNKIAIKNNVEKTAELINLIIKERFENNLKYMKNLDIMITKNNDNICEINLNDNGVNRELNDEKINSFTKTNNLTIDYKIINVIGLNKIQLKIK